nr:MAG TPA: hypothetical protein [Caudoviricetes sp.]
MLDASPRIDRRRVPDLPQLFPQTPQWKQCMALRQDSGIVKRMGGSEENGSPKERMNHMKKYYIAYGSNMDFTQMRRRCPDAELVGAGIVKGYELLFKGSGSGSYATIEREAHSKVSVLVWRISAMDEESLDRYEGFPTFYYKTDLPVKMQDGAEITGMVYIMDEKRTLGFPSHGYARILYDAYINFGWDTAIIDNAFEKSSAAQTPISR